MAACTFLVGTADTGATPNTSGAFSPTLNDLLIVLVIATGTAENPGSLTNSEGLTFTQFHLHVSGTDNIYCFVSDALVSSTASQTVTFDTPSDPATGTIIFVFGVSGMNRIGTNAIRQVADDSSGAAGTPNPAFSVAALTENPTLGIVYTQSNPAAISPPASWTEPAGGDLGYNSPITGGEVVSRDSGFTGTTITWGSSTSTRFLASIVELDTSVTANPFVTQLDAAYV